ncbi:hypothetical protein R3P38DRAFT_3195841 [Favolaschia claudopus]|uniref:Uncharacterized protein n=1 Tax=Favolaschia claudopus TaxID=2862362 RepID=A0AAW0B9S0_9AGAR
MLLSSSVCTHPPGKNYYIWQLSAPSHCHHVDLKDIDSRSSAVDAHQLLLEKLVPIVPSLICESISIQEFIIIEALGLNISSQRPEHTSRKHSVSRVDHKQHGWRGNVRTKVFAVKLRKSLIVAMLADILVL